jgi:hypothetical protein
MAVARACERVVETQLVSFVLSWSEKNLQE